MASASLNIPQTKPASERIDGRLERKMSPFGLHAQVQLAIAAALRAWAIERGVGRVGTEWDYDLTPPGDRTHRIVPDVAFLAYDRVAYDDDEAAQIPRIAPNVAIEILSEGQSVERSQRRIAILLACQAELLVFVDPRAREAWLVDRDGTRHLRDDDVIAHPALSGFHVRLQDCFEKPPPHHTPTSS